MMNKMNFVCASFNFVAMNMHQSPINYIGSSNVGPDISVLQHLKQQLIRKCKPNSMQKGIKPTKLVSHLYLLEKKTHGL